MLIEKTHRNSVKAFAAIPVLTILLSSIPARAQSGAASYVFLIGSGSLCDAGDSGTCPAVVKSEGGDTFEISGAGIFNPQQKTVMATGTFTHRSLDGNALETGIWVADEIVSFDPYGASPSALMRGGGALGPASFGSARSRMFATSMPAGGLAVLHIHLLPMRGAAKTATLQVNCALGKVPVEHPTEGVRLAFERGGTEYDDEVSGRVLFLLTRPGASTAAKSRNSEVDTKPAPTELPQ
ncbi:MAG: hypothetical protein ABSF46_33850 [Terriglobia bacterium]